MESNQAQNFKTVIDKYHFYYDRANRSVICTTFYKGKSIRAVAKCDPEDSFNLETGKKLAYLRCRHKFLLRKAAVAADAYAKTYVAYVRAENKLQKAVDFVNDTERELSAVIHELCKLEDSL